MLKQRPIVYLAAVGLVAGLLLAGPSKDEVVGK